MELEVILKYLGPLLVQIEPVKGHQLFAGTVKVDQCWHIGGHDELVDNDGKVDVEGVVERAEGWVLFWGSIAFCFDQGTHVRELEGGILGQSLSCRSILKSWPGSKSCFVISSSSTGFTSGK